MSKEKVNRRNYLKTAGAGIAGLAVGLGIGYGALRGRAPSPAQTPGPAGATVTRTVTADAGGVVQREVTGGTPKERALNSAKSYVEEKGLKGTSLFIITEAGMSGAYSETAAEWESMTGTKIEQIVVGGVELYQKTMAEAVAKTGKYDMISIHPYFLGDYADSGIILPIDDWIRDYDPRFHGKPDGFIYPGDMYAVYKGQKWYLPIDQDTWFAFYRKDLMDDPKEKDNFESQYGYQMKVPDTWDEYRDLVEFFHRPPDLDGCGDGVGVETFRWPAFYVRLFSKKYPVMYPFDDDMHPTLTTPEGIKAANEFVEVQPFRNPDSINWGTPEEYEHAANAKAFALTTFPSFYKFANLPEAAARGKFIPARVPGTEVTTDDGTKLLLRRTVNGVGLGLGVSAYGNNPELAYLYIQYVTSPEVVIDTSVTPGSWGDPCRYNQVGTYPDPKQKAAFPADLLLLFEAATEECCPQFSFPSAFEYHLALDKNINRSAVGEISPEDAMQQTEENWEEITERVGRDKQKELWRYEKLKFPR